ncbi:helix-turn-helix domain-containing protein [Agarivorans aestuarii]|uniref:Helix-turn-helix domain-containing protein n=1 Tax=Agarivorans aestuarii TaxID=1563703 RepID=A0ABU7G2P6_9ALTE|nr:helix-turn-helix domain-containing protein [Agarivorans aestuarii]MEE1673591.1 helix-turn-helix domain-containing protein [Agarivorans aestuarii]
MKEKSFGTQILAKAGYSAAEKLTPAQAADVLSIQVSTLATWRCNKRYTLQYMKVGGRIFYPAEAIIAYLDSQIR